MGRSWIFLALFAASATNAQTYSVGGSVSGNTGSGLQLELSYGECIADNQSFTLNSTQPTDCFSQGNRSRCCSDSIKFTAYDGISTVQCTCGTTVIMRPEAGGGVTFLDVPKNAKSYQFGSITPAIKFTVSVNSQPSNPHSECTVQNPTGVVQSSSVTNVNVVCIDRIFANGFN